MSISAGCSEIEENTESVKYLITFLGIVLWKNELNAKLLPIIVWIVLADGCSHSLIFNVLRYGSKNLTES